MLDEIRTLTHQFRRTRRLLLIWRQMCALFATDVFVIDRDVMHRGYDHTSMIITGDDTVLASQVNGGDVLNAV